jgi:Antirestriction protein (ArdA)
MADISNNEDILDVRDIIARVEELEDERDAIDEDDAEALAEWKTENDDELDELTELLSDLKGYGGDEQWRGDWYPVTLIRDSHFRDYAEELADDIGAVDSNASWPMTCIDWDQAARELQQDYSAVEYGSVTYWYR